MEIIPLIYIILNSHVKHSTFNIFFMNLKKKITLRLLGAEIL